ncbi:hypothetical protein AWB67_02536 [Caballeronia terrestris]|uniref:Uncharacterized protein n=1 Tax=Caballeronia terrestris TaxID=1226301 RepID=A0A158IIT3_9BURK|nr:hypothetical protein AWB67_02536 [Caballeronia terrestris]
MLSVRNRLNFASPSSYAVFADSNWNLRNSTPDFANSVKSACISLAPLRILS